MIPRPPARLSPPRSTSIASASAAFLIVALAALLVGPHPVRAQLPGSLDLGFNPAIRTSGTVNVITPQTDGKLIIGGTFSRVGAVAENCLARLNADGSLDTGFTPPANLGTVYAAAAGTDGKIVVFSTRASDTNTTFQLMRLNADGSPDASFAPVPVTGETTSSELYPFFVAIQADGKILLAGNLSTSPADYLPSTILRFNTDGSPDATFQVPGTLVISEIDSLLPLSNGQVLVGGGFDDESMSSPSFYSVVRLNADGSRDDTYPAAGDNPAGPVYAFTLQADGKVLYLQSRTTPYGLLGGVPRRLNADGTLDTSFAPPYDTDIFFNSLLLQPDGKVVVGGIISFTPSDSGLTITQRGVVRLNADGGTDAAFQPTVPLIGVSSPLLAESELGPLGLQANGQIIVGGDFTSFADLLRVSLGRLNADGSADDAFTNDLTNPGDGYGVAVQPDGQILLIDSGTLIDGTLASNLVGFHPDGSPGTVYSANLEAGQYYATRGPYISFNPIAAPQADGKVLVTAAFEPTADGGNPLLERFNADGSPDSGFQIPSPFFYSVLNSVLPQTDGHIYVAGVASYDENNQGVYPLNRLDADGSFDAAFTTATDPGATTYGGSTISALAIQADGKVVAGGAFDSAAGTAQPGLLRFNTDGSVDPGFSAGVFATTVANTYPSVSTLAVQSDGKIIVGGLFETIGGVAASSVARLNTDGSVDTSFNAGGVGPDTYVTSVVVQPDGDIVVAGAFATFNGVPSAQVARLRGDGSVDPLFFPGAGTGNTGFINSLALAPDGSILLAGSFTTFDGQPRDGVARLIGGEVIAPVITSAAMANAQVGQVFTYAITAVDQPTSYAASGLPVGLSLSAAGVIGGTPTGPGTFAVAISATNAAGTGTATLTLTILPAAPVLTGASTASGQVGVAFAYSITASNGPTGFTATGLPGGLTVNSDSGLIMGTPTAKGTFQVTLGAANTGGTGTATLLLVIAPATPTVTIAVAGDGDAVAGEEAGKVIIYRAGDTSTPLTVHYKVAGDARAGVEYKALSGVTTIPVGAEQVKVKIKPINDHVHEGVVVAKVKLKAATDGSYVLGSVVVAKVKIIDND